MPAFSHEEIDGIYAKLLISYRQDPGNILAASASACVSWGTASRAWNLGWMRYGYEPIRQVLEDETRRARGRTVELEAKGLEAIERAGSVRDVVADARAEARAQVETAKHEAQAMIAKAEVTARRRLDELMAKANIDIVESRAERAQMIRDARRSAAVLLDLVVSLYRDYQLISARLTEHVLRTVDAKDLMQYIATLAKLTREANEAATSAMALEDRELGRPDVVVGVQAMPLPEAMAAIDEAKALADLIRAGDVIDTTATSEGELEAAGVAGESSPEAATG